MAAAERSLNTAPRDKNKYAAFQQLFAGISAGIATTICTHPLDLIKTRMQSTPPYKMNVCNFLVDRDASTKIGGIFRIAKQVYGDERRISSFYRGLSPNMIGNAASWGFYFMW
jgi:solute carrier family 25 folate transporter 32